MMEMEVNHPSQQDMDLIDILWKQDIDLGARREVFDYIHRQKEFELQRQQELEQEKRQHLIREQEKALLAQLQLDEETGEYIPRRAPLLQTATTPLEVTQNVQGADAMSLDECLQLLAETFQVEETQDSTVQLDASVPSTSSSGGSSVALPAELSPGPLLPAAPRMSPEMEQAWVELLSLPELQQCLNMQMHDTLETTAYALPNPEAAQTQTYPFYREEANTASLGAADFMNALDLSVPNMATAPDSLVKPTNPQLNFGSSSFCDVFYPAMKETSDPGELEGADHMVMSDVQNKQLYAPVDLYSLSPGDPLEKGDHGMTPEMLESDSGMSSNNSVHTGSPQKSLYGDSSFGYSDSDLEEMDLNPGSAESDYSEMFSINFKPEGFQRAVPVSGPISEAELQQDQLLKPHKTEAAEDSGHTDTPFTKDKRKKRADVRLTRDEQRAKALKIPFTVDMIINRPVEEFNEMMSKHQLNEAQLALVRDIRRRGKNKVAAQNCRKRKMENIVGLESELDSLKDERERLLDEKTRNVTSLKKMKQQLNSLYLEVFSMLRDEKGNTYSPADYSLQQSSDGSIFLVPRTKKTFLKRKDNPSPAI
ncbi:nuclear factor erythroid 2-related factor 2a isoform 1-T1 [Synchiropus picturatus]